MSGKPTGTTRGTRIADRGLGRERAAAQLTMGIPKRRKRPARASIDNLRVVANIAAQKRAVFGTDALTPSILNQAMIAAYLPGESIGLDYKHRLVPPALLEFQRDLDEIIVSPALAWTQAALKANRQLVEAMQRDLLTPSIMNELASVCRDYLAWLEAPNLGAKGGLEATRTAQTAPDLEKFDREPPDFGRRRNRLLRLLRWHPRAAERSNAILQASRGVTYAEAVLRWQLDQARKGIDAFRERVDAKSIWHFPAILVGGMRSMKIAESDPLAIFIVEYASYRSGNENLGLYFAANVVACVGLIATGGAVGLALAGLDFVFSAAQSYAMYQQQEEKGAALNASVLGAGTTFSMENPDYTDVALMGAATLLPILLAARGMTKVQRIRRERAGLASFDHSISPVERGLAEPRATADKVGSPKNGRQLSPKVGAASKAVLKSAAEEGVRLPNRLSAEDFTVVGDQEAWRQAVTRAANSAGDPAASQGERVHEYLLRRSIDRVEDAEFIEGSILSNADFDKKTVAVTEGMQPQPSGAGWSGLSKDLRQVAVGAEHGIDDAEWYVREYEARSGIKPVVNGLDYKGVRGSYFATHAEAKTVLLQVNRGVNDAIGVTISMCPHCRLFLRALAEKQQKIFIGVDPTHIRVFNADGAVDIYTYGDDGAIEFLRKVAKDEAGPEAGITNYYGVDW